MRPLLVAIALAVAFPAAAAAEPRITVSPRAVDHDATQTVKGRGWPVIEFCKRTVRIRLVSDQNLVTLGRVRVRDSGALHVPLVAGRRERGRAVLLAARRADDVRERRRRVAQPGARLHAHPCPGVVRQHRH